MKRSTKLTILFFEVKHSLSGIAKIYFLKDRFTTHKLNNKTNDKNISRNEIHHFHINKNFLKVEQPDCKAIEIRNLQNSHVCSASGGNRPKFTICKTFETSYYWIIDNTIYECFTIFI